MQVVAIALALISYLKFPLAYPIAPGGMGLKKNEKAVTVSFPTSLTFGISDVLDFVMWGFPAPIVMGMGLKMTPLRTAYSSFSLFTGLFQTEPFFPLSDFQVTSVGHFAASVYVGVEPISIDFGGGIFRYWAINLKKVEDKNFYYGEVSFNYGGAHSDVRAEVVVSLLAFIDRYESDLIKTVGFRFYMPTRRVCWDAGIAFYPRGSRHDKTQPYVRISAYF